MEENLKDRLTADITQARRDGDAVKRSLLQLVLAGVQNAEIANKGPLENDGIIRILKKEARQHRESIDAFTQGNRLELAAKEEAEMVILEQYLPTQMGREEVVTVASRVITEMGASGPGDKGKVMGKVMAELKGKADGSEINEVVTELLNS